MKPPLRRAAAGKFPVAELARVPVRAETGTLASSATGRLLRAPTLAQVLYLEFAQGLIELTADFPAIRGLLRNPHHLHEQGASPGILGFEHDRQDGSRIHLLIRTHSER